MWVLTTVRAMRAQTDSDIVIRHCEHCTAKTNYYVTDVRSMHAQHERQTF